MTLPGHVAVAYLLARRGVMAHGLGHAAPVLLGALLPDLVDKARLWLGHTAYGRTIGHSLLVWAIAALLWRVASRRRVPGLLLLGWLSHLATDLVDDVVEGVERSGYVFSAWFGWPLTNPDMWSVECPHFFERLPHAVTTLELATVAACLLHATSTGRAVHSASAGPNLRGSAP